MKTNIVEIPLHDIKPILEIKEYSLYYFLGVSFAGLLLACGIIYLIYKYLKSKNRFNLKKEHLKCLNSIDFSDPKKAAYEITLYGRAFSDDSSRHEDIYQKLVAKLGEYKYKKEVNSIDKETLELIELYRSMCNV